MKAPRKIMVYIASADGYIARPDGDIEWLNRRPSTADYGMNALPEVPRRGRPTALRRCEVA